MPWQTSGDKMKTSDLIKQAEELLGKCSDGPWTAQIPAMTGKWPSAKIKNLKITGKLYGLAMIKTENAEFICFARNHMQELVDRLKKYEDVLEKILRLETVEFKEKTHDPNQWLTVHMLVEKAAREALEDY